MINRYWLTDKSAPFATFLNFLDKYYHPEIRHQNFGELVDRANSEQMDGEMARFHSEFVQLLQGHRDGLHPKAIFTAAEYDDWENDDDFLVWLWRELYPDERVPRPGIDGSV